MFELMDYRMQQHLAHEIYRRQIMQRIPDPLPASMLPFALQQQQQLYIPRCPALTGVAAKLENSELWQEFHRIGTEMIITKTGRRIFPSMRLSLSGLEEESNYCVLLEMVPIGDCRYKFSGSQWVPAGGAEPQSPQRMYLHPDSPAAGAHWQAQPILFSKVKLTNNTLDNSGHIVLASMHKYQPRIHVIRTSDLTQIPWAPQQAFVFPETEFVAVTAYQNERITKLKIDNNPFAKGFRETGQSRYKRKVPSTQLLEDDLNDPTNANSSDDEHSSVASQDSSAAKRLRTNSDAFSVAATSCHNVAATASNLAHSPVMSSSAIIAPNSAGLHEMNCGISVAEFTHPYYAHARHCFPPTTAMTFAATTALAPWHHQQQQHIDSGIDYSRHTLRYAPFLAAHSSLLATTMDGNESQASSASAAASEEDFVDVVSTSATMDNMEECGATLIAVNHKPHSFSISAILGGRQTVAV